MPDKPLVFLIHGMGVHDESWSGGVVNVLDEQAQKYAYFNTKRAGKPLDKLIDFEEVVYDDVLQDALENWDKNNAELLQQVAPADRKHAENAVGWLEGMGDSADNFAWTHIVDVLLWRFSPYLRNTIKARVADQITKVLLAKTKASDFRYVKASVISHSLGTAVAHDVLADIAAGRYQSDAGGNGFDPSAFRFESLHTIANVSRVLELEDYLVYTSCVCPGEMNDPKSYCKDFYNYRNKYDPFTHPRCFEPPWEVRWYHDKAVSHLRDRNPHAIEHYLLNPKVHIPMLRSIMCRYDAVSPIEETEAIQNFKDVDLSKSKEKRAEIEKRVNDAIEVMGSSIDMVDLAKGIQLFFGKKP